MNKNEFIQEEPLVTIVLLNWNGYKITLECLASLQKVQYENFNIVVVDNGSIDNSIIKLKEDIKDAIVKIDYLALPLNKGFTGGNNKGIEYAFKQYNPDYFLLLNNDTIVDPLFLKKMINAFKLDAKCFAVVPKIYYYDKPKIIWFAGGRISRLAGTITHNGVRKLDSGIYKSGPTGFMNGCCALICKESIAEIGVLDERFFATSEDVDYSFRILDSGHTIQFVNEAIIYHKTGASFKANKGEWLAFYLGSRGLVLLQKKHLKGVDLYLFYVVYLFRWVVYLSLKLLLRADFKSIKAIYIGAIDGITNRLRYVN